MGFILLGNREGMDKTTGCIVDLRAEFLCLLKSSKVVYGKGLGFQEVSAPFFDAPQLLSVHLAQSDCVKKYAAVCSGLMQIFRGRLNAPSNVVIFCIRGHSKLHCGVLVCRQTLLRRDVLGALMSGSNAVWINPRPRNYFE